jgi:hypothetical protein
MCRLQVVSAANPTTSPKSNRRRILLPQYWPLAIRVIKFLKFDHELHDLTEILYQTK